MKEAAAEELRMEQVGRAALENRLRRQDRELRKERDAKLQLLVCSARSCTLLPVPGVDAERLAPTDRPNI